MPAEAGRAKRGALPPAFAQMEPAAGSPVSHPPGPPLEGLASGGEQDSDQTHGLGREAGDHSFAFCRHLASLHDHRLQAIEHTG